MSQPTHPFVIQELLLDDIPRVIELIHTLREFFPRETIPMIEFSLKEHKALVGTLDDEIVSFLVYELREKRMAEILWMGVAEDYHGLGLGTLMLEHLEQLLQKIDFKQLVTSTLSYTVPYEPYEKVRSFFYHRGFKALGIQRNYYEEGIDRLILAKEL